jgi:type II secretory pathway component PulF
MKETGFEVYRFSSWKFSVARPKIYGYFNTYEGGSKLKTKFIISFGRFAKSIFTLLGLIAIHVLFIYYFYPNNDDLSELRTFLLPFFLISLMVMTFINFWYEVSSVPLRFE